MSTKAAFRLTTASDGLEKLLPVAEAEIMRVIWTRGPLKMGGPRDHQTAARGRLHDDHDDLRASGREGAAAQGAAGARLRLRRDGRRARVRDPRAGPGAGQHRARLSLRARPLFGYEPGPHGPLMGEHAGCSLTGYAPNPSSRQAGGRCQEHTT